ncbi:hypothetical protein QAD02_000572 [Eretmocerus hayati]|uniref:Uncharacterized protein n=1 Tax=Eretmocerus hayati TaxID=131215 RepID=A0ACC2NEF4_9HYME|nr:hypothetical protein QAD02_000572 [Eretmocerus hayati]
MQIRPVGNQFDGNVDSERETLIRKNEEGTPKRVRILKRMRKRSKSLIQSQSDRAGGGELKRIATRDLNVEIKNTNTALASDDHCQKLWSYMFLAKMRSKANVEGRLKLESVDLNDPMEPGIQQEGKTNQSLNNLQVPLPIIMMSNGANATILQEKDTIVLGDDTGVVSDRQITTQGARPPRALISLETCYSHVMKLISTALDNILYEYYSTEQGEQCKKVVMAFISLMCISQDVKTLDVVFENVCTLLPDKKQRTIKNALQDIELSHEGNSDGLKVRNEAVQNQRDADNEKLA